MVSPILIATPPAGDTPEQDGYVIMQIALIDLQTIFQRALNTWSDVPRNVLALSDKLEKL
jgi:hypothetical protein